MSKLEVIDLPAQKEILVKFTKIQKILKYNPWNNDIYILLKPSIPFLKNTKGLFLSIIAIRSIIFASLFITVSCSTPKKPVIIQNQSSKIAFQSDRCTKSQISMPTMVTLPGLLTESNSFLILTNSPGSLLQTSMLSILTVLTRESD